MLQSIFCIGFFTLATALGTPYGEPSVTGWNGLLKSNSVFSDRFNIIQVNSKDKVAVLSELKQLLSQDTILKNAYQNYRKHYKASYDTSSGSLEVFKRKLVEIVAHNLAAAEGRHSWWMGVNQFTDLTTDELKVLRGDAVQNLMNNTVASSPSSSSGVATPASFSYVEQLRVTPVKNSLEGAPSGYFAAAAVIESNYAIKLNLEAPVSISVHQLWNCIPSLCLSNPEECADGAYMKNAVNYFEYFGTGTWNDYPYSSPPAVGECVVPPEALKFASGAVPTLHSGISEDDLKQLLVEKGTLAIQIHASDNLRTNYGGGVYPGTECGESDAPNHDVALVGYGSVGGEDYWLIKNCWGQNWGEQGFLKLARNGNNVCGLLSTVYSVAV